MSPIEPTVQLYVLVEGQHDAQTLRKLASSLIAAGVHALQLRDKLLCDRLLVQRARLLRELTAGSGTLFVVNDRPDVAALADADGVHVGQEELCVADARAIVGPSRLVGVSTHSIQQAREAVEQGADYIGCGPTFASQTKRFDRFPGLEFLRQAAAEIRLPAFAIGGVNEENLPLVLQAGFSRIAVSGAVTRVADPAAAVRRLLQQMEAFKKRSTGPPEGGPVVC